MEQPDEDLIADYQHGNQEAFEMLFERYKRPIFNFSLRILNNRADAEDVTSEVFTVLFTNKDSYRPQAKFSTWLFTVARNACITKIRRRKHFTALWFQKENSRDEEVWDIPDPRESSAEQLVQRETAKNVKRAVNKLQGLQKEALILREYQQMSYEEISVVLNCSLENVKILIFRAREALRVELYALIKEPSDG